MSKRDLGARESSWIALRSNQISELPSAEKRDLRWPRVGIAVGSAIVAMTTMALILYHVCYVLGDTFTDASRFGSAGVPVVALYSVAVWAVLILIGVVSRLFRRRRRRNVLDGQPAPQVNNRHVRDLAGMR